MDIFGNDIFLQLSFATVRRCSQILLFLRFLYAVHLVRNGHFWKQLFFTTFFRNWPAMQSNIDILRFLYGKGLVTNGHF
jgi:hypothetical protein